MVIGRACIRCGRLAEPGTSRCAEHAKPPVSRHRQYRRLRERIIEASSVCGICGQPLDVDPNDPTVLDHRVPRALGGDSSPSNLQASHRTCNARKSAKLPSRYS